ncbi:hypothetical protein JCM19045_265 [Bacillus sp. JCM 19045]|nr:hypothetical protein JCM19045_265 [Bacillus sp. JCM 19045]
MKAFAKTTSAVLVSVAVLAACGSDEETGTGTENEGTENVSEPETENEETNNVIETGTDASEDDEAESENDEGSENENEEDDQSNESDNEGSDEEVFEPVEAGEEHEAAATKEDTYLQAGMVSGGK